MSNQHKTLIVRIQNLQKTLGWIPQPESDFEGWGFSKFVRAIRKLEKSILN